jgi:hypothetical protein
MLALDAQGIANNAQVSRDSITHEDGFAKMGER